MNIDAFQDALLRESLLDHGDNEKRDEKLDSSSQPSASVTRSSTATSTATSTSTSTSTSASTTSQQQGHQKGGPTKSSSPPADPPTTTAQPQDPKDLDAHAAAAATNSGPPLLEIDKINILFRRASVLAATTWIGLVILVYTMTPREEWKYLSDTEREGATLAFCVLLTSTILTLSPFFVQRRLRTMSPIVYAAIVTQLVAMCTNGILAFCPTVVMVDPITHARVFLIRWCEWIPLGGLMTFFAEAVEIPKTKKGVKIAVLASLCQSISCTCGPIFPYCNDLATWSIAMFVAIITYAVIFPRLFHKRHLFLNTKKGHSFIDQERYDRIRFSYEIMFICTVVWTLLVVLYFLNMIIHRLFPVGHILRHEALAMGCDTLFDVIAKALYMKVIVDVHFVVFDAEGRAQRQLSELRNLMSVLWDKSSDVIIISVRHSGNNKVTSLISPSLSTLVGCEAPEIIRDHKGVALLVEFERNGSDPTKYPIEQVYYVDSYNIPYGGMVRQALLAPVDPESNIARQAISIVVAAWNKSSEDDASLLIHPLKGSKGEECSCEVKVSNHAEHGVVAIVRDVTERYRRFEAERRAHAETLARQKDAQSQTRFVRHEVKNGLLAGIELCDNLRNSIDDMKKEMVMMQELLKVLQKEKTGTNLESCSSNARRFTEDLDANLHEVLDTVLAEAMARDVVHEIYKPRLERLDVISLLMNCSGSKVGKSERFPINSRYAELPYLQLDPQLLRYIHRNAISNACKYGKSGGTVATEVRFDTGTETFVMNVINDPGDGHEVLLKMDNSAASDAVFTQGSTLHSDIQSRDRFISSGDGAWIMQKCAKTMGGSCNIKFEKSRTVFTFSCPAEPLTVVEWPETKEFEVPPDTWGIAIDDSKIQRKLMDRILAHAGVPETKRLVIGKTPEEVGSLEGTIVSLLDDHPNCKMLVLIDENLDYGVSQSEHVIISGSLVIQGIFERIRPSHNERICALVRSANDSAEDVCLYLSRTHGFFPKAPMQRDRVREILAPLWAERFLSSGTRTLSTKEANDREEVLIWKDELLLSLTTADRLILENEITEKHWSQIWSALHSLQGDLMVLDKSPELDEALAMISSLKGDSLPDDIDSRWRNTRDAINKVVASCTSKSNTK